MPTMAPRVRSTRKTETAPAESQEEVSPMSDDVYEPEAETSDEPAKRGRKADPLNAALKEFKEAKAVVEVSRQAVPLDEAEARFETAKAVLAKQMEL